MSRSPDPFLILGNSAAKGSPAPKGRNIPAQGIALGNRPATNPSPEGAAQEFSTDESPQGWRKTTFGELIRSVSINDKKLPASQYAESGKFPVVDQGKKSIGGYSDDEHRAIYDELPLIVFGDHTRIFKYLDRAFVPGADGIKVLKPIGVDAKWLFHIAHALDFPDKGYARHFQYLKQATVFVPPLPEQRRIVARIEELFSRLDAGVAALRHAKAQLQRYRQSVLAAAVTGQLTQAWREQHPDSEPAEELLQRILKQRREQWNGRGKYNEPHDIDGEIPFKAPGSWSWTSNEAVCASVRDGTHDTPKYVDEGVPLITSKNLLSSGLSFENTKNISQADHAEISKRSGVSDGDILFAMIGTIGNPIVVRTSTQFSIKNVALFKSNESFVSSEYLRVWLSSPIFMSWLEPKQKGTTQKFVPLGLLRSLAIPLPPLAEQHQIVAEVEARTTAIDHLDAELDRQITRSNHLRRGILASAFSGQGAFV